MKNRKKIFKIVLILVVVVLIAVGLYFGLRKQYTVTIKLDSEITSTVQALKLRMNMCRKNALERSFAYMALHCLERKLFLINSPIISYFYFRAFQLWATKEYSFLLLILKENECLLDIVGILLGVCRFMNCQML